MSGPDFGAIVGSLSTAASMAKGFLALKSEGERQQMVIDLQQKILDAQETVQETRELHYGLAVENSDLLQKYRELLDQKAIVATMTRMHGFEFLPNDEEPCCSRCVEVDTMAIHLTRTSEMTAGRRHYACPACKTNYVDWRPRS